METVNNKTLEKLKYELVRDGIVTYETLEKAEEIANVQNINIGQALINSNVLSGIPNSLSIGVGVPLSAIVLSNAGNLSFNKAPT